MANSSVTRPLGPQQAERGRLNPLQVMKDYLSLSDEQAEKLTPVLKEQQDKLNALRRDTSLSRKGKATKLKELQQGTSAKIKAQLTPEQAAKWQKRTLNASAGQMTQRQGPGLAKGQSLSTPTSARNDAQTLPNWRRSPAQTQPAQPAAQPAQAVPPKQP
jgi:hypothetical protein